jgi:hypothetical protein
MTADILAIDGEVFSPAQCSEEMLENLLRTVSPYVFDGYKYFDFRPPIPSRHGTRHPDGALVAPGSGDWWVVEVELHTHDVQLHIEPQLEALAEGAYGEPAVGYLLRHAGFVRAEYPNLDVWQPSFLLVCDVVTPQITRAAARTNFEVLQFGTYRSGRNRYALALAGARPRARRRTLAPGVDVSLRETEGVTLLLPIGRDAIPAMAAEAVRLGDREMRLRRTGDGAAFVVPLAPTEVQDLVGVAERYRLTFDARLIPADPTTPN